MTEQRRIIARLLQEARDHPDVSDLHRRAAAIDASISIATIYRTVRLFLEAGMLEQHDFRDGKTRYETVPETHHDHLIDLKSGRVVEFCNPAIEKLQEQVARELGFRLVDHRLELYGEPLKGAGRVMSRMTNQMMKASRADRPAGMGAIRAIMIIAAIASLTLAAWPVQWLALRFKNPLRRRLPHHYHRLVCRIMGLRIHMNGQPAPGLMVGNHVSWMDIPVLAALMPVSFVARSDMAGWALFGNLARMQESIFVRRDAPRAGVGILDDMRRRLADGGSVMLFAEGTSSVGRTVLAFHPPLLAAADRVQPVSIAYTGLHGLPLTRARQPGIAWFGDMDLIPHLWRALCRGPVDVAVTFHDPVSLPDARARKEVARRCRHICAAGVDRRAAPGRVLGGVCRRRCGLL